jgi:acyl-CoA synthetase (AMP-forming)/AMP-acid ligase II
MHGTGLYVAMQQLTQAGSIISLPSRRLDVQALLATIDGERVTVLALVGDTFCRPMLSALVTEPNRWDISSLRVIVSSGALWSADVKRQLLEHQPRLTLIDMFASSEAAMGQSVTRADSAASTARFVVGPDTRVLTEDGNDVVPGSGQIGLVASGGFQPLGYFKDAAKTATTFRTIGGRRYAIPGDYASVDGDGVLHFAGRGSSCINTGGEKVFPEEVEAVIAEHPEVRDAAVVGVPDDRFGEVVVALVEGGVDPVELIAHVRDRVAPFKAPKRVVIVESLGRGPNGKLDHQRLRDIAAALEP